MWQAALACASNALLSLLVITVACYDGWLFLQSLKHEDAENIGYVIPTPVIDHFINDYARNGQYTAFPALGVEWQKMESPFMRKALGMKVQHAVYLVSTQEYQGKAI